jgi:hypothetical protein
LLNINIILSICFCLCLPAKSLPIISFGTLEELNIYLLNE